jgi:Putative adhesin
MSLLNRFVTTGCILAALSATASAKIERSVEKSFQVQPGARLTVSTAGGDIRVAPSSDSMIKVVAKEHIRASSEAEADALLQKLDLVIEQHGNDVTATASYREGAGFHFGSWPPVQVDFVVTVPSRTSVDLKTSGGDVAVGDLDGAVRARTSGGEIELGKIGADIDASTSGGSVRLDEGRGIVKLSTSGGNISAGRVAGPADLRTSGGDIRIDSVENTLSAHTSGGDVKAVFAGPLKGDCSLSTSGGEVKATLGQGVGFQLDAATSGGDVNAAGLTITIDRGGPGKSSLSGSVNGGGPLLKLRSSGGDIVVASRKDAA